jgi:hypothetical protein
MGGDISRSWSSSRGDRRADGGGHVPGVHIGKGGMGPASLSRSQQARKPTPVQGANPGPGAAAPDRRR